jgi:hypothetical protein
MCPGSMILNENNKCNKSSFLESEETVTEEPSNGVDNSEETERESTSESSVSAESSVAVNP